MEEFLLQMQVMLNTLQAHLEVLHARQDALNKDLKQLVIDVETFKARRS